MVVNGYNGKLLVLISEWGLEHASKKQIERVYGPLSGFNEFSPIIETIKLLNNDLENIKLLPADIGLFVGMNTGSIYLKSGSKLDPEKVSYRIEDEGVEYFEKKLPI